MVWIVACWAVHAQAVFSLSERGLVLESDTLRDEWPLPYPIYRFCTGDIDGDGCEDALVGVVKATRFYPEEGRRLFIFKNYHGHIRPLWMGSKLGGELEDFRFIVNEEGQGRVRSLETTADHRYVVADYRWRGFGLAFDRFLLTNVSREEALLTFEQSLKPE
jgi:hypothetical protein